MITTLMPVPKQQYFAIAGVPLVGGKVYTYDAGTTRPKDTYTKPDGSEKHENPIRLNARGEPSSAIFWSGNYRVEVRDALGNLIYTVDNYNTDPADVWNLKDKVLDQLADDNGSDLVGFSQDGAGNISRTVQDELRDRLSVKQFGAVGDGVTDDTAAIMAAYQYFTTKFFGGCLIFPQGRYLTKSQIVFNDLYFKTLVFDGATICGGSSTTQYDAIFKIVNAQNSKIAGALTVCADTSSFGATNDPNKYKAAFSLQAAPGGGIEPTKGILNFIDIYGLTTTKSALGVDIGSYDNDAQIAEINFHGLQTPFCPSAVRIGGSQAVVSFLGGNITSTVWPSITNPVYSTFIMDGGAVSVVGGEITNHGTDPGVLIDFRPAKSSAFQNPYGAFIAIGTLIETKWPFLRVNNPRALASPLSTISHVTAAGCYGYSGELPASMAFASVDDASYAGKLVFDEGCHFYQSAGASPRAAATINCSTAPNTIVQVGRTTFRDGYPRSWLAGVSGGRLLHGLELGIQAFVNGGTSPAGASNLKPTALNTSARYQRYSSMYNLSTGIITIPATGNGVDTLRIEASFLTGTTGDVYLQDITNNRIMCWGQNNGSIANLVATISDFTPGQQFAIMTNFAAPVNYGGAVTNNVNIFVSTN